MKNPCSLASWALDCASQPVRPNCSGAGDWPSSRKAAQSKKNPAADSPVCGEGLRPDVFPVFVTLMPSRQRKRPSESEQGFLLSLPRRAQESAP